MSVNDLDINSAKQAWPGVTESSIKAVDKIYSWAHLEKLLTSSAQDDIRDLLNSRIDVCSNARVELLGELGLNYFHDRASSIQSLFSPLY